MSELYPNMECFDCFNEIPDNSQLNLLVNNTIKQICIQCSKNVTYFGIGVYNVHTYTKINVLNVFLVSFF